MLEESMSALPSIWAAIFSWCTPAVLFVVLNLTIGTIFITSGLTTSNNTERWKQQQQQQDSPSPHRLARSPSVLHRLKSINFYNYRSQESVTGFEKSPNLDLDSHLSFPEPEPKQAAPVLSRSPSMLDRFKSINLSSYLPQESVSNFSVQTAESESHSAISDFPVKTAESDAQAHSAKPAQIHPQIEANEEETDQFQEEEQSLDEIYNKIKENQVSRTKSDTKPSSGEIPKKLPRKMKKSASTKSAFAHFEEDEIQSIENRRPATAREATTGPKVVLEEADEEEVDARADDFINKFKHQLKLQRIDSIIRYKEMVHRGKEK